MESLRTIDKKTHLPQSQRVELIGFPEHIEEELSSIISRISQQDCIRFNSEKAASQAFLRESYVSCIWVDASREFLGPKRPGVAIAILSGADGPQKAELIRKGFSAFIDLAETSLQDAAQIICAYVEKAANSERAEAESNHNASAAESLPSIQYSNLGLEYLAVAVEHIGIGIYVVDYTQRKNVAIWNKEMERLFRVPKSEAIGNPLEAFLRDLHLQKVFHESHLPHTRNRVIFPSKGASRSNFIADVSKSLISDEEGRPSVLIGIIKDITNRIHSENRLIAAFNELESSKEKLEQSNLEIRKGIEKAKRLAVVAQSSNKAKSYFLSNISHELRTPLNSIVSLSYALLEGTFGKLNNRQRENLEIVSDSSKHLQSLINDILDLSKIELGKLNLKLSSTPIRDTAISSIRMVEQQAAPKNVRCILKYTTSRQQLTVDAKRLRQILLNLLVNAIKFTKPNTEVTLLIEDSSVPDALTFKVIDQGIGIHEGDYEKIFSPFTQLDDSLSRQYEGTGLGLAIASKFVELHGGSLSVESQPDIGSTFKITLPESNLSEDSDSTPYTGLELLAQSKNPMPNLVLIVDENERSNVRLTALIRELEEFAPVCALPNEISAYHDRIAPVAVFVDMGIIEIHGSEWISHAQQQPAWKHTQWILIGSLDLPENLAFAKQLRFSRNVIKPLSTEDVSKILYT